MPTPVILVAEDNDLDAMLLERLFERCGRAFQMMRVADGEAAIDYLAGAGGYADRAKFPLPQVLLLDLKMPRTDGFGVLQWRQTNPASAQIPVVVFSSSFLSADIRRAYALGANSYVVKPNDPARMEQFIRTLGTWWTEFNVTGGSE